MTSKEVLKMILAHLKKTGEPRYTWARRVMKDPTFLWKIKNINRTPHPKTIIKIERAIKVREAALARRKAISGE